MLLFWGYPTHNTTFCVSQSTVGTWKECMDLCLASDMCMLSYGSETSCILCDIFAITKILQTDSSGGIMVAVKVDQQDQCPADVTKQPYTRTISFPISLIIGNNANIFAIVFDIISTPLIVQISYLLNNRKSLKQALTTFKFANFIRVLLDIEVKSTVEPIPNDQPISIQMKTVDNK
uniref:CW domain-containing protein n=1 Tax=Caenorhabditis tropicalis TaxID=1561998 RepID=A0A1I7U6J6_9PELO